MSALISFQPLHGQWSGWDQKCGICRQPSCCPVWVTNMISISCYYSYQLGFFFYALQHSSKVPYAAHKHTQPTTNVHDFPNLICSAGMICEVQRVPFHDPSFPSLKGFQKHSFAFCKYISNVSFISLLPLPLSLRSLSVLECAPNETRPTLRPWHPGTDHWISPGEVNSKSSPPLGTAHYIYQAHKEPNL